MSRCLLILFLLLTSNVYAVDPDKSFEVDNGVTLDRGAAHIGSGSGLPTYTAPRGSRYYRTDTGEVYRQTDAGMASTWNLTATDKHSDLSLDDGTNPHGTTKADVGLGSVPNIDATNRSSHTGTQTASTISDFDVEVGNNSAVTANTAKVSADGSINTHSDVDTVTVPPSNGDVLSWNTTESNWEPVAPIAGALQFVTFFNATQRNTTSNGYATIETWNVTGIVPGTFEVDIHADQTQSDEGKKKGFRLQLNGSTVHEENDGVAVDGEFNVVGRPLILSVTNGDTFTVAHGETDDGGTCSTKNIRLTLKRLGP